MKMNALKMTFLNSTITYPKCYMIQIKYIWLKVDWMEQYKDAKGCQKCLVKRTHNEHPTVCRNLEDK